MAEKIRKSYNVASLWQAAAAATPKFHVPRGNSKLGSIPAFNLLPGVTCSATACATCLKDGCYAVKNCLCHGGDMATNNCLRSWAENTALARDNVPALEAALMGYFAAAKPRFFRLHSAGDFLSGEYAQMWYRIAAANPDTRFLAFTKQFAIVSAVSFWQLPNFELVLSAWPGVAIPPELQKNIGSPTCRMAPKHGYRLMR